ncbi:hypothetical protein BGZ57DRAFT_120547 [Hyaloscypha finlandica]|nr:hypothetical protein BGZ57DRAFT_120547 [Hyaloscypha finlandica]
MTKLGGENNYPDGAILRNAFQEILKDPQRYLEREDVTPIDTSTGHLKNGMAKSGVLTNSFLLIDPICVDSVDTGLQAETVFYEIMRVLPFPCRVASIKKDIRVLHGSGWTNWCTTSTN